MQNVQDLLKPNKYVALCKSHKPPGSIIWKASVFFIFQHENTITNTLKVNLQTRFPIKYKEMGRGSKLFHSFTALYVCKV